MDVSTLQGFRLSPRQSRLWRVQGNSAFRAQGIFHLTGQLDRAALGRAVAEIVARHEILRTRFPILPGLKLPVQAVEEDADATAPSWTDVDLTGRDAAEADGELSEILQRERRLPVDADEPSVKMWLVRLAPAHHAFMISLPALAADTRSLKNLFHDLVRHYEEDAVQVEEPMQYADFAEWHAGLLEEDESEGRAFWRQRGHGEPGFRFPFEREIDGEGPSEPVIETVETVLDGSRRSRLEALAARCGADLEGLLYAAWQVYCWRLSGISEITVIRLVDGRAYDDLQEAYGLYAVGLPVRVRPRAGEPFARFVERSAQDALEAASWQEYFCWEDAPATSGATPTPLAFEYEIYPEPRRAGGLELAMTDHSTRLEHFHLLLACAALDNALRLRLHFDLRRFSSGDIARMSRGFSELLDALIQDLGRRAGCRLDDLEAVSAADRQDLEASPDPGEDEAAPAVPIQELFESQARRSPGAVALVSGGRDLTYGELDRRANRLARYLVGLGVAPEERVGLLVERSAEMAVALLAVWKAGAAYVALDPQAPWKRNRAVLADASATRVLSRGPLADELADGRFEIVDLDRESKALEHLPASPPPTLQRADSLAYVAYTSGSTGVPKGILSTHGGVINFLRSLRRNYGLGVGDRVLQIAPLTFDASIRDLVGPLVCGAATVLLEPGESRDPGALVRRLADGEISAVLSIVPTLLRAVVAEAPPGRPLSERLRLLLASGEPLFEEDCRRLRELFPRAEVVNLYGPSETTMTSSFHRVDPAAPAGDSPKASPLPLGRPLSGVYFRLASSRLRAAPPGATAEILIGGAGVGRGYLGQPALTAARFVPDPYSEHAGQRVYRTGDLALLDPAGRLCFRGRCDHQVKLRGVRLEPGEVESALRRHPDVEEACVVVRDAEGAAESALVAYVVGTSENPGRQLVDFLRQRLPPALVPSRILTVESLPRRPNGKVDRAALCASELVDGTAGPAAPADPTEEVLAGIWCQVLGRAAVGRGEDFFELGGHSLLATQLSARVKKAFGVDLAVRKIFEAPTLAEMAEAIESARNGAPTPLPAIEAGPRAGEHRLSYAQERLWFLQQLDPGDPAYNVSSALRLRGELDAAALECAVAEIVRRHEALRTRFVLSGGDVAQVVMPAGEAPFRIVDLREERASEALDRAIAEQVLRPFDLGRDALMRVTLHRLAADEHVLLVEMHHIASDRWSAGILVSELCRLYTAFIEGRPSPLADLPIQYTDYARWQRRWLRGEVLDDHLAYWRKKLSGGIPRLALPVEPGHPVPPSNRGARSGFTLSRERLQSLHTLGRDEGVTLFMTLLAALDVLLEPYARGDDVVVGTDIANRTHTEVEGLIGFFVNVLPLSVPLTMETTFRELLGRVREVTLEAYAHQALPFEKIVQVLEPERENGQASLFQVLFVLQNTDPGAAEMPGLVLEPMEITKPTAKFDLLLMAFETPDGLRGIWNYRTDLFSKKTVDRLSQRFQKLISRLAKEPDRPLGELACEEKEEREMITAERNASKLQMFMNMTGKAVDLDRGELIRTSFLNEDEIPIVVEPVGDRLILEEWARDHRDFIDEKIGRHGAILFRGFVVGSVERFESFAEMICGELFDGYGDLPRGGVAGKIYETTPYPPEKTILYHNESSQMHHWPLKQFFYCIEPAPEGGETPIVDCRKIYRELDPAIRSQFEEKGIMYFRTFTDSLDVDIEDFFGTSDREAIEGFCRAARIETLWEEGPRLKTRKKRPAVAVHPKTGERCFFNQIQAHHVSLLESEERQALLSVFGEDNLPRNVYFGDGSPIEDAVVQEIVDLYEKHAVSFSWQRGDLLLVDNMLVAHSRRPYRGPRKIVVAMGQMVSEEQSP